MKRAIITVVLSNVGLIAICALALLLLPLWNATTVITICTWFMRGSWIAFALWFFWPYLKRGAAYLINHREE